ncbi:hypothetical protein [Fibrella forsythiae]|uniref:Uncharacterized protein n=1 Tax=Fibrella forsythiae TaxID=2817061 RepID=A0ABS3JMJ3_9BACT|nr:hypothetical protein [Fibrella forsythiae]MBO0951213.1 hypothetical protein [Fibrella forsythiae]
MKKEAAYQPTGVVLFNQLPPSALDIPKIRRVDYKPEPGDPGLKSLLKPFLSKDGLRPAMMNVFFGATDIVATDGHRIALLPHKTAKPTVYSTDGKVIDERYPDYPTAFPVVSPTTHKEYRADLQALRSYTSAAILFTDKPYHYFALEKGPNDWIGLNGKYLLDTLTFFEKLGATSLYINISERNRIVLFSQKPYRGIGNQPVIGLMPNAINIDGMGRLLPFQPKTIFYPTDLKKLELRAYWSLPRNLVVGHNPQITHTYNSTSGQWTRHADASVQDDPSLAIRAKALLLIQRQRLRLAA